MNRVRDNRARGDGSAREQVIFALEVAANDPAASEESRREAERCLRNQRALTGASGSRLPGG